MPSVQLLFGPMLVGTYVNAILYGVMVLQMVIYVQIYKNDATGLRLFVLYLFVTETLNTGLAIATMYEPLVQKYATVAATTFFPLMLPSDPILTVLISTPIQLFIAWRIRVISRTVWLGLAIGIFAIISMSGGIWLAVTVVNVRRFVEKPELHWPALMWLLASAIADITITISLAYYLAHRKSGFTATDDTINKIIRITVQTGLITTLFSILDVICFLVLPHTTINLLWDFSLSKLYTNALISTLNARGGWGNLIDEHSTSSGRSTQTAGPREPRFPHLHARGNAQTLSTGIYESGSTPSRHSSSKIGPDMEYGITITKEVERSPPYHSQ